ncbi:hypothetical protein SCACP_13200 [Sporomusa carbonis]|uniref:PHP domain-containing protein n=1 Tax=Sporomusa carbonis TaxID=3076075 RepID=UPI003A716F8B
MKRRFIADLHVHSLLSPCAAVEMTPHNIVCQAVKQGIDIIAITDHNACDNVVAALEAAKGTDVTVLPGMEVESKEEVHIIVLFEKMRQLKAWSNFVDEHRLKKLNDVTKFGAQFIVDADDNFIAEKPELLLAPLTVGIAEISEQVRKLGGICIASHIDRPSYSLFSKLGFIPPDVELAAVEVSRHMRVQDAPAYFPAIGCLPVITSSDAHTIDDFISGPRTVFNLEQPTLEEVRQALSAQKSRKVVV